MNNLVQCLHPTVQQALQKHGIVFTSIECDPEYADTALFCEHYNYSVGQSANAIITASRTEPVKFACCIVLGTTKLDVNKVVSKLMQVKKVSFASAEQTMQLTGMQIGGVTPFGLPELPIYIDAAVMACTEVVAGGGNRQSKVLLAPVELLKLPGAVVVEGLAVPKAV